MAQNETTSEKTITLPSGATVTFRDPKTLRVKDRRKVLANASKEEGLMQALSIVDGLIAILVKEWSFEFPPPSIKISVLGELTMPDYDMLSEEAGKAQEILFPNLTKSDATESDPDSPFGDSNA